MEYATHFNQNKQKNLSRITADSIGLVLPSVNIYKVADRNILVISGPPPALEYLVGSGFKELGLG